MNTNKKPQSHAKKQPSMMIEREYLQVFNPMPLPSHGLYTEEDSLEQPSELPDVPSISVPSIEA
jgi:hypothetical protein